MGDYTIKEYMNYIEHINACVNRINENGAADWTPHKVELAVWTYYILHDLKPELLQEVQQSEEKQVAAVTSNDVGEDWVMVEKEECPAIESIDKIPPAPIKRLHENTDQGNNVITSDDAIPLQKKLRTDESNCEQ